MSRNRYLVVLLYCAIVMVCGIIVAKPGASIFYIKHTIDKEALVPDAGFAFRYKPAIHPLFYRAEGSLLFEDGNALTSSQGSLVVGTGDGNYSLGESPQGERYLYLSASDNSNPVTNEREYKLYLPISFISRSWGVTYLFILLFPAAWFLSFVVSAPAQRQALLRFPKGILIVLNHFFDHTFQWLGRDSSMVRQPVKSRGQYWKQLLALTILSSYLYVSLEWIFFVTMPSFMSMMGFIEKAEIYLLSGLAFSLACMPALVLYFALDLIALLAHHSQLSARIGLFIPTTVLSALSLLLIDNFTYTIFKFGISTSGGIWRGAYALLLGLIWMVIYSQIQKLVGLHTGVKPAASRHWNWTFYSSTGMLAVSMLIVLANLNIPDIRPNQTTRSTQPATARPNIILLGSDGLNATHLSAYGYERDTSPNLRVLTESSLLAENAFSNSGNTGGSVISIMTSKLPTQTRVLYAPDILMGENAYQHLPGILKQEGYRTIEFGVPNYMDAYSFNLLDGFDMVNGRSLAQGGLTNLIRRLEGDNTTYFLDRISSRITERIAHIFYQREMQNPYRMVTQPGENISDEEKINKLLYVIDNVDTPVFIHAHLMGTHGGQFTPTVHVFAKKARQDEPWDNDFYDDAILSFDGYVGKLIEQLKSNGQFDNTILIIYTDHAMQYRVNERIPLIIHFPGDDHAGRIIQNVQNLDISPTILDYLGITQPEWMRGKSLLSGDLKGSQIIFGTGTEKVMQNEAGTVFLDPRLTAAPFYQFSYMDIINCQRWYLLDLNTLAWTEGQLPGHTAPCTPETLLNFAEIKNALAERLTMDGFDIVALP